MITFKEAIKIKLGGSANRSNPEDIDDFLDEFQRLTDSNPMAPKTRLYNGVLIQLNSFGGSIHISDIMSREIGSGKGTAALKMLIALADKHDVTLTGIAQAYSPKRGHVADNARLKKWYRKHGFKTERDKLKYEPNS